MFIGHYPISHSLLIVVGWSVLFAVLHYARGAAGFSPPMAGRRAKARRSTDAAIYVANITSPPPPSAEAIAWVGLAAWLFVPWGWWIDRHREARG